MSAGTSEIFTSLKWIFALIILALCGKSYYLIGFEGHLKPIAHWSIILFKDVFLWLALAISIHPIQKLLQEKKMLFPIVGLVSTFFLISLVHLFGAKGLAGWAQHYFRNVISVFLFFVAGLSLFRNKGFEGRYNQMFLVFLVLNLVTASLQLFFFPSGLLDRIRPLGLVGDPITLSILIYMSMPLALACFDWKISAVLLFFGGCILNSSASVSAIAATSVASLAVIIGWWKINWQKVRSSRVEWKLRYAVLIPIFLSAFWVKTYSPRDTLLGKTTSAVAGVFQKILEFQNRQSEAVAAPVSVLLPTEAPNDVPKPVEAMAQPSALPPPAETPVAVKLESMETVADSHEAKGRMEFLAQGRLRSLKAMLRLCLPTDEKYQPHFLKCLFGDFTDENYIRVDSNLSSLTLNWGLIGFLVYYIFVGWICWKSFRLLTFGYELDAKVKGQVYLSFWIVLNVLGLDLSCANIYRYPVNLLFMLALSHLLAVANRYQRMSQVATGLNS